MKGIEKIIKIMFLVILLMIVVSFVCTIIFWIRFADAPIEEVPDWLVWLIVLLK